jgi:hypothetical protein
MGACRGERQASSLENPEKFRVGRQSKLQLVRNPLAKSPISVSGRHSLGEKVHEMDGTHDQAAATSRRFLEGLAFRLLHGCRIKE